MTVVTHGLCGYRLAEPIQPGTPAWFRVMSASKIGQVIGVANPKWGDEYTLWHEMNNERHLEKPKSEMARGHEFEPMMRDWFQRDHPQWTVTTSSTWVHNERPWQTADPDGEVRTEDGALELYEGKTADDIVTWDGIVPESYFAQCQWQMDTIGARRVHLAACGPFELWERKPKYFVVDYDPDYARRLRERGLRFIQSLELGVEPVRRSTTDKAMLAVRWKNPTIVDDPGVEIPAELAEPYLASLGDCPTCMEARNHAANLLEFLGSAKKATYRGVTIANRVNGRNGAPPYLRAAKNAALKASA